MQTLSREGGSPTGLLPENTLVSEAYSWVEPQRDANICQSGLWPEATGDTIGTEFLFFVSFIARQIDDSALDTRRS